VACLDALDEVLDDMSTAAYAGLDPATRRGAVERLRRLKARLTAHEMAAVRALDAALGDKARTGEMLPRTTDKLPTAGGTPALITVNIDLDDLRRRGRRR
jgi:hypothetical protein